MENVTRASYHVARGDDDDDGRVCVCVYVDVLRL